MSIRSLLALVASLLAAAACRDPVAPPRDVAVSVAAATDVARWEIPVDITVTITNAGAAVRTVYVGRCQPTFELATRAGSAITPSGTSCLAAPGPRELQPGETLVVRERLTVGTHFPVAPGDYDVRARVPTPGGLLYSAPVPIRVE